MTAALGPQTVPDTNAPHLCLWNTAGFYSLRDDAGAERLQVDHVLDDERLVGSFVGGWDGPELVSGFGAPFGGPDFVRDYETVANVVGLVRATVDAAAERGAERVRLRLKPPHYGETELHLQFALFTAGFTADAFDLNYFVDLRPFDAGDAYEHSLKAKSRRAIRHAQELGLRTDVAAPTDDDTWREAYRVLEQNRVSKGRPMRLPFDYVRRIRDEFPLVVRLLATRTDDGAVCAAALLYRIAPGHDVVQYWGDAFHDLPHSPMGLLVRDVVDHSLATGGRFLDLGISTDHGVPNQGLIQFKRNIGAEAEMRLVVVGRVADVLDHPGWALLHG